MANSGLILILLVFISTSCMTQNIDRTEENRLLLESRIKEKIDSVRVKKKCSELSTDSILYRASLHHSNYQRDKKIMSHNESAKNFKTPQDRADFYGANGILVGENVLYTDFNNIVSSEKGKKFDCSSIENLANLIVTLWVDSPPHYKNIIDKNYTMTGVSVAFDTKIDRLYATQVFGFDPNAR